MRLFFRCILLTALGVLLFSQTLQAANAPRLNGVWVADIDATLVLMTTRYTEPLRPEEMEEIKETLAALEVSIDLDRMTFSETGLAGTEKFTIKSVTEKDDTVTLKGDRLKYTCTFRPDGTILMGPRVVLRKK